MPLDLTKLENVKKSGDKTIARCPACAEDGGDDKGEHLVIQPDGKFGCALHPGSLGHDHRRKIYKLAGKKVVSQNTHFPIRKAKRPKIEILGRVGRVFQTYTRTEKSSPPVEEILHVKGLERASDPSGNTIDRPPQPLSNPHGSQDHPSEASGNAPLAGPSFLPNLKPLMRSLDFSDPNFEAPRDGSLVLGLYRENGQSITPLLLWADPENDLLFDVGSRRYINPPRFYIPVSDVCPFDPYTGNAVVDGAICPF